MSVADARGVFEDVRKGGGGFLALMMILLMCGTQYSLNAPTEVVKQIIVNIESGVEVEVTIAA